MSLKGYTTMLSLILILLMRQSVNGNECAPCSCDCPRGSVPPCIICSDRNLTSLPKFPANLTWTIRTFAVGRNRIPTLEKGIFNDFPNLTKLILMSNGISNVRAGAFSGLGKLKVLYLSNNNIHSLPDYLFKQLGMLETLDLKNNRLSYLSEKSFHGLGKLKFLDLSHNKIQSLPRYSFQDLGRLGMLYLKFNKLSNISEEVFNGLGKLNMLFLDQNEIGIIPPYTFRQLGMLQWLDLQYNNLSRIFEHSFNGLGNMKRLYLSNNAIQLVPSYSFQHSGMLHSLYLENNRLSSLSENSFHRLRELKTLYLSKNEIHSIPSYSFKHLGMLNTLYLKNNRLSNVSEEAFDGLGKLKNLDLSYNKIRAVPPYTFRKSGILVRLYLGYNKLSRISEGSFSGLGKLLTLDLSNNEIQSVPRNLFQHLVVLYSLNLERNKLSNISEYSFNGLGKLKMLYLSNNKIQSVPPYTFRKSGILQKLDLSYNNLSSISEGSFNGLEKLGILDLSNNELQLIPHNSFNHLGMLYSLRLEDNILSKISEGSFNGLGNLKRLDLSYNEIKTISSYTFRQSGLLTSLSLRYNKLSSIFEGSFDGLRKLQFLHLTHNGLQHIPRYTFRQLGMLEGLHLDSNKISNIVNDAFAELLRLKTLELGSNQIETIESNAFTNLLSLAILGLKSNNLTYIPTGLWTTDLSDVTLSLESNPFPCSCQTLNEMKQLQHRVDILNPNWTYYEIECSRITSVCEEERNFALGMKVGHTCLPPVKLGYSITDGNSKTYGSCNSLNFCSFYIRIELPGIIVVTEVTVIVRYTNRPKTTMSIDVGDKLSGRYKSCHNGQNLTFGTTSISHSCDGTPYGRDVRVKIMQAGKELCSIPPRFSEVIVKGYEENKYNLWSNWNQWGPCNEPCGNGYRARNRTCIRSTSLKCLLPDAENQRAPLHLDNESCNLEPCFQTVYQWTIGGVAGAFILIILAIVFWYRKFKMVTYFDGLRPNPNFELDPNRTLLEQIEELPYDLHWEFPRYDVRFGPVLGEGNFGRVWHARAKGIKAFNPRDRSDLSSRAKLAKLQDQRVHDYFTTVTEAWVLGDCNSTRFYDVAVKTLKECATPKHKMDLASELKLLIYMDRHPNIVNVLAACTIRGDLWIIMEYCDHGCLQTFLSDRRNRFHPSWSKQSADILNDLCFFDLLQMCEQVIKGLMFLHFWKVVHRDISARNILVDANCKVKIADFGLARTDNFVASVDDIMPIKWSALESLLRHEYTTKSDIWSVGVLFWEIFSLGEMPYPGMTSREVIQQLKEGYRMDPPSDCPDQIWKIISDTWMANPEERPSTDELFQQLDDVKVSVCAAPDGQYYGTGDDYGEAGTIEGQSLEEILESRANIGFEDEDVSNVDIHSTKGDISECRITYKQYCDIKNENTESENKNQVSNSIKDTSEKNNDCKVIDNPDHFGIIETARL